MNFQNLDIKISYDSIKDDLYDAFFIPVLSNSVECKRFGGNFSSKNFLKIAEGMKDFVMNDGIMQLILFPNFSQEDIDAMNSGLKNNDEILLEHWIKDYAEIPDQFTQDHTKALAWMLKNKFLEIKILKITDLNGNYVSPEDLSHISLLKEKIGIFKGEHSRDFITFRGNLDYDDELDYSHITTFRYWDEGQRESCDEDYDKFEKFWDGEEFEYIKNYNFQAIDLPAALEQNLINVAPDSKSELNFHREFTLRKIQQKAVQKWKENGFCGIYEMATGTGKTRTAIGSMRELEKTESNFVSIIVVPTDPLAIQWKAELEKWGYTTKLTLKSSNWKQEISDYLLLAESNDVQNLCIITTYVTFSNILFQEKLDQSKLKKLLIADEVHHAGAANAQTGLLFNYDFRLGLTATIKRYFDEEGTKIVTDYFHDVVYRYTMSEAIRDGYLCEYVYHIRQVDLTDDEYVDYREESLIMARYYSQIKKNPDALEKFQRAAERRANIVKSADNKLNELSKIIQEGRKLNYGLVYCNFDQIREAQNILTDNKPRPIHSRQVTQRNTPLRKQKEEIFQGLVDGLYDVILAINILDEGWDCPEVRRCILMASSGNEKQFVQRRGRILRPFDKTYPDGTTKEFAEIYDMCVLPNILDDADDQVRNMEMGLIKAQLNRMQIMADSAKNEADCYEIINNFKVKFGLSAASEK